VVYLSPTIVGKTHDYAMFKDEFDPKNIPKDIVWWFDKGFTCVKTDYPDVGAMIPKKKPKGKELSKIDKELNRLISGIRMPSEHTMSGIKRLRIVADKFRNKTDEFNDKVMYLACGLWNYHLEYC